MMLRRKVLFTLLLALLFTGTYCTYASEPIPTRQIAGTWLYLWWHGDASIAKTDGTPVTKPIFIPESYREADDQKSESFLRFRDDGTGTYFKRYVVFKNNGERITVMTKGRNGQWVKGDRPDLITNFSWEVREEQITIRTHGDFSGFNQDNRHNFIINTTPTRRAPRSITSRLCLTNELIIYGLGQFLKVGPKPEQDLLKRYNIDY